MVTEILYGDIAHRVVQGAVNLCSKYFIHKAKGVVDHSVHLRDAPQRIWILNVLCV